MESLLRCVGYFGRIAFVMKAVCLSFGEAFIDQKVMWSCNHVYLIGGRCGVPA